MPQIPAARSTLAILRYLARRRGPVGAATLARDLGLPRSSAYQLLAVMMDEGFVVHYPEDRTYGLSGLVSEIGTSALRSEQLGRLARPLLDDLVARSPTPVVAHLAVLSGADVMYAGRAQGFRAPTTVSAVGVRLPAHLTATGRAMLARLPHEQVRAIYPSRDRLVRRASAGPSTLGELDRLLDAARERGWAVEEGDVTDEYASVAASALDRNGYPTAAIGLTYRRDSDHDADALGRAVVAAADALTARLAGQR
ncbi:IclR family transcriptional regulator [Salinibacterium soli]|uniref:IclR family transcriptional regulator n=1 Tax=Antiquaquibacter soli TaxID=3064523 RepID=A0ABT9BR03_9MICO|nr:IclR family transcriptional regulator [Protaetiibacter sp. WY-16]MDO7882863.1 IclR family transcriptional regulator [Protaetiibacter sp. WY-16]